MYNYLPLNQQDKKLEISGLKIFLLRRLLVAKLTTEQEKDYYERQKRKETRLRLQLEAQKKKELEGDGWEHAKEVTSQSRDKILQEISGVLELPKVYDSIEIDSFFPPIEFFKKNDGSILEYDYRDYQNSQKKYNDFVEKSKKIDKKDYEDLKAEGLEKGVPMVQTPKKENSMPESFYINIGKNFTRFAPIYDKHICTCCGIPKKLNEFYINFNPINANRIDYKGNLHMPVCKNCAKKLFDYLYEEVAEKSPEYTMKYFCGIIGEYWDSDVFYKAQEIKETNKNKNHIIEEYLTLNNAVNNNKIGIDSLTELFKIEKKAKNGKFVSVAKNTEEENRSTKKGKTKTVENVKEEIDFINELGKEGYKWTPEDLRDRKIVVKMVGYDPFYFEEECKRPSLYRDLIGMLEQGMEQDQVKLQAAIQIVISYSRVRRMNEEINKLEKEGGKITDIKALSDLKNKELKNITDFSRDNGFSERFATAKARGENTFTGIMNRMNEAKFENSLLNMYDIETSETIQQAANASFKSIFEQLSLGESDVWKLAQDQLAELLKIREENNYLKEELRKSRYEIAKKNLIEKAQKRGIELDEEDEE